MARAGWTIVAVLFALRAAGAPAQVEVPTGSRVARPAPADAPNARLSPQDEARAVTDDFARCVVLSSPRRIEVALRQTSGAGGKDPLAALATDACLRQGELRMPTILLRGSMFRALYRQFHRAEARPLAETPPDFTKLLDETESANARLLLAIGDLGDCVARTKPAESRKLVLATAGAAEEQAALDQIVPALGPCVSTGVQLKLNKSIVVGAVAEALYREAQAAHAPTPQAAGH